MKTTLCLVALLVFSACSSKRQPVEKKLADDKVTIESHFAAKRMAYVSHPAVTDTLCITEIERAKRDLATGKMVFAQRAGFLFGWNRYEQELRQLCAEKGLVFDFEMIDCVELEGQTQGCYADFMDKAIAEKFGPGFRKSMLQHADSLFLLHANNQNKLVQYWDCDERPRLPNESRRTSDEIPAITLNNINIKKDKSEYAGWPFFDLGFIVEKDSTVSGFYSRRFVEQVEDNKAYEQELYLLAVNYVKTNYPIWVPGKIKGVAVRTDNNVRVFFHKKSFPPIPLASE